MFDLRCKNGCTWDILSQRKSLPTYKKTSAGCKLIPTKDVFPLGFFCNDLYLEIISVREANFRRKA